MVNIVLDEVSSFNHWLVHPQHDPVHPDHFVCLKLADDIQKLTLRILFGDVCFFLVLIGTKKQFPHTESTGNLIFFKIHEFVRSWKTKSLDLATQTLAQVGSTRVGKGNVQIWQQYDQKGQLASFCFQENTKTLDCLLEVFALLSRIYFHSL